MTKRTAALLAATLMVGCLSAQIGSEKGGRDARPSSEPEDAETGAPRDVEAGTPAPDADADAADVEDATPADAIATPDAADVDSGPSDARDASTPDATPRDSGVVVAPPSPCWDESEENRGVAVSVEPHRTEGVAPLHVFFDTTGTTSSDGYDPFHELSYCWDFGDDPTAGWEISGRSRNRDFGPQGAHLYESPGTYTAQLWVRAPNGGRGYWTGDITVSDPEQVYAGNRTTCLSASGNFTGCPSGARELRTDNIGDARPHVGTNQRILLRRGDEFVGRLEIKVPGPSTFGAYGEGPKPLLVNGARISLSDRDPELTDLRIMDIAWRGGDTTILNQGMVKNVTFLRLYVDGASSGPGIIKSILDYWNQAGFPGHTLHENVAVYDTTVKNNPDGGGGNGMYIAGKNTVIMGTTLEDCVQHCLRTPIFQGGRISHSRVARPDAGRHGLKIHAPPVGSDGVVQGRTTENIVISDNVFVSGEESWHVAIGPQDGARDERIRQVLVERNFFEGSERGGVQSQTPLVLFGVNSATVRNNVFNLFHAGAGTCIRAGQRGIEPDSDNVYIVNNTCNHTSSRAPGISVDDLDQDIFVQNNLLIGQSAVGFPDNTKWTSNLSGTDAGFTGGAPADPSGFQLGANSPAVDSGTPSDRLTWDFGADLIPLDGDGDGNAQPDVGAFERP